MRPLQLTAAGVLALAACDKERAAPTLFELIPARESGVTFVNALPEKADVNILNYLYYYNGGGVAAGDIDGDGLPDLYFTSNLESDRLYLNKGNYRFEDITEKAGVSGSPGWTSGVTMADVNGDGRLDIYVSAVNYLTMKGRNVLYINNGDRTFTDRAAEYGLDLAGYATQAAFFDYDGDGDLDVYLLNHSTHGERGPSSAPQRAIRNARAGDKLLRNDNGHFVDVSASAGIYGGVEGYGLGVVVSDVNLDGCPDIYVANDFQENDFLYLNSCDGTFTESISKSVGHTSRFSMGVDAADFNNDLKPDIVVLDMLPEREEIRKTSATDESYSLFNLKIKAGYHPQYARNTLQLNEGGARFSDIGYLAGIYATDWSWAPLFADLDNDGRKDLFVTNGIYRRPNDLDYIKFVENEAIQRSLERGINEANLALLKKMPQVPIANYAFHNNGDLTFTNRAKEWGLDQAGFSNGAVYVDLNNSGALDLVVNNVNAAASIYRNRARELTGGNYLTVVLRGSEKNTSGIGAKVFVWANGSPQLVEQMPTRGFESSVDPRLHFGLGAATRIDSLMIVWPDKRFQKLTDVQSDQILTLSHSNAAEAYSYRQPKREPLFADITRDLGVAFKHEENSFVDFNREPLMPSMLSTEGPALAIGDVNGDGLDDIYIGGAKWQRGRVLIQRADGRFTESRQPALDADSVYEDVDAVFLDANGDRYVDLYVVTGGNEFSGRDEQLRDRLYLNDGRGNFQRARNALPDFFETGGCVAAGDFNGDGHVDLFVGRRAVPRGYGLIPQSHLLENDGTGRFVDVTVSKAPALARAGMVSSATWVDYDNDGKLDLVVTGEWMPVRVFRQESGRLVERTRDAGLSATTGWWNTVVTADLNGDGYKDLALGNVGLNSYIHASPKEPARLYVGDFFGNGTFDQILTAYNNGVSYPIAGRDEILAVMPELRGKYATYASFGASRIEDIVPKSELRQATVLEAQLLSSSVALNNGKGKFVVQPLPVEAQLAPIYAIVASDFDRDGNVDLLVGGNFFGVTPLLGRYDASHGLLLRGVGGGRFTAVESEKSGVWIDGQVRDMKSLNRADSSRVIAVARNNDSLQFLRPTGRTR